MAVDLFAVLLVAAVAVAAAGRREVAERPDERAEREVAEERDGEADEQRAGEQEDELERVEPAAAEGDITELPYHLRDALEQFDDCVLHTPPCGRYYLGVSVHHGYHAGATTAGMNRSLDDFAGGEDDETTDAADDAGAGDAAVERTAEPGPAADDTDDADDGDDEAGPSLAVRPAESTMDWTPGGAACAACERRVERRWRDDGRLVCIDCKRW